MLLFGAVNFPGVAVLDKWGLRKGVIIGLLLTTVGLWIRCFMNYSFTYAILGTVVLSMGQPFLFNVPPLLSANWFPKEERIVSTTVGCYSMVVGMGIGCFIPSLYFGNTMMAMDSIAVS